MIQRGFRWGCAAGLIVTSISVAVWNRVDEYRYIRVRVSD